MLGNSEFDRELQSNEYLSTFKFTNNSGLPSAEKLVETYAHTT